MPGTYAVLAPIYEKIGMAEFAQKTTPRLINYAQRHDWTGRRILDLGCGTGGSAVWLCQNRFTVTGVDSSAEMLEIAARNMDEKTQPLFKTWRQDIRSLQDLDEFDLALALGVLNELDNLRDLEKIFSNVKNVLGAGRLFIFDLYTIEGLTQRGQSGDKVIYDGEDGLMVITRDQYDYDRQIHARRYIIFSEQGGLWQKQEANRILRGYPVQAVVGLLQRSGFSVMNVFNPELEPFEPGISSAPRVLVIARKQ